MSERLRILYLTIDPVDHRAPDGGAGAHQANFGTLQSIAAEWRPDATLEHVWCQRVTPQVLEDPQLLAIILAGSFTEWVEAFRQPAWKRQLDDFGACIRATRIPILAICGSHQYLAYVYGGWHAVGHMAPVGHRPIPIADESDGILRASNPRPGEVGVYRCRATRADPILAGLAPRLYFVEYHHDEVLSTALPAGVVSLIEPDGIDDAIQRPAYEMSPTVVEPGTPPQTFCHRPVQSPQERCQVQALRYFVPPAGRLLYSVQFHPDLAWRSTARPAVLARENSRQLMGNFLDLADRYWRHVQGASRSGRPDTSTS